MTDVEEREKVIRGLEAHANPKTCETCAGEDCPYYNMGGSYTEETCSSFLAADALALLKEQEERIKFLEKWTAYLEAVDRIFPARADRSEKKEKVLKTIKNCILKSNPGSPVLCEECPYYEFLYADDNEDDCLTRLMRDAVEIMEGE